MIRLAIIGTSGRDKDKQHLLTRDLYEKMLGSTIKFLQQLGNQAEEKTIPRPPLQAGVILVSGGAAWADHLAITLYLNREQYEKDYGLKIVGLELYYPCPWDSENRRFLDRGFNDWRTNPGKTANYYHQRFSQQVGIFSLQELDRIGKDPNVKIIVGDGFHDRNNKIAEADHLVAFGWSEKEPTSGGTLYTWNQAKQHGTKCYYMSLSDLTK